MVLIGISSSRLRDSSFVVLQSVPESWPALDHDLAIVGLLVLPFERHHGADGSQDSCAVDGYDSDDSREIIRRILLA